MPKKRRDLREILERKYGAKTAKGIASRLLRELEGMSVPQQLRARKIIAFRVIEKFILLPFEFDEDPPVVGRLYPEIGGFLLILKDKPRREWTRTIGHELGHTFFCDLAAPVPTQHTPGETDDEKE